MPIEFTPDEILHFVRWTSALKSGKYEQWRGNARRGNRFCAIGLGHHLEGGQFSLGSDFCHADTVGLVTQRIANKLGLAIPGMNDDGMSFSEIAARMEATYAEHNADAPAPTLELATTT